MDVDVDNTLTVEHKSFLIVQGQFSLHCTPQDNFSWAPNPPKCETKLS